MTKIAYFVGILLGIANTGLCLAHDVGKPSDTVGEDSLWSRLDVDVHGYFKLDASYDSSRTVPGEFAKWVVPQPPGEDDGYFSGTTNQTRLNLKVTGPDEGRVRAGGLVEIDFFGEVESSDPRIRHAFLELTWPAADVELLIGQTSDVISPLAPSTLNYTVAWWAGNIGFRRPQIRLTKTWEIPGARSVEDSAVGDSLRNTTIQLEGALTHNIYDTKVGSVTGEDAGPPALQARVSVTRPGFGALASTSPGTTIGLSGHRAWEGFDVPSSGATERFDSWSLNLDLTLPITASVRLLSELWTGCGLAPYLGGVGQGVNLTDRTEIHSRGGWIGVDIAPGQAKTRFGFGLSVDDVDGDDVGSDGRTRNRSLFGNVIHAFNRHIDVGAEISGWRTEYKSRGDADALRSQISFFYRF